MPREEFSGWVATFLELRASGLSYAGALAGYVAGSKKVACIVVEGGRDEKKTSKETVNGEESFMYVCIYVFFFLFFGSGVLSERVLRTVSPIPEGSSDGRQTDGLLLFFCILLYFHCRWRFFLLYFLAGTGFWLEDYCMGHTQTDTDTETGR